MLFGMLGMIRGSSVTATNLPFAATVVNPSFSPRVGPRQHPVRLSQMAWRALRRPMLYSGRHSFEGAPMLQYAIKVALSAVLIVVISEIGKRSSLWSALIASLPLTSLLAFVWLYLDTGDSRALYDKSYLSDLQDLDYASAIAEFYQRQTSLQATQMTFAKLNSISLFNYL